MSKKEKGVEKKQPRMRSIDQMTIARLVSNKTGLTIAEVQEVIELEQKYTMEYIKKNVKVIKKNYITLIPTVIKSKKFVSPLDGQEYDIPSRRSVSVKVGSGFKAYISDNKKKMPEKICRFVDGSVEEECDVE